MLRKRPSFVLQFIAILSATAGLWVGYWEKLWPVQVVIGISVAIFVVSAVWHRNITEQ